VQAGAAADAPQAAADAGSESEAQPDDPATVDGAPGEPNTDTNAMPDGAALIGSWYGPAEDLLGRKYDGCFVVQQVGTQGPAGTVRYTGALECEYDIEYIGVVEKEFAFKSIVKSGRGCFPSTLRLTQPSDNSIRFSMYINDGDVPEGAGTLVRVDACPP